MDPGRVNSAASASPADRRSLSVPSRPYETGKPLDASGQRRTTPGSSRRPPGRHAASGKRRLAASSMTLVTAMSAPSVTRESTNTRSTRSGSPTIRPNPPDTAIPRRQLLGIVPRDGTGDGPRDDFRVNVREPRFETVGDSFDQDTEERLAPLTGEAVVGGQGGLQQGLQAALGPSPSRQAGVQYAVRGISQRRFLHVIDV